MTIKYQVNKGETYRFKNGALVKLYSYDFGGRWIFREIGSGVQHHTNNPDDFETLRNSHELKTLIDLALDTRDSLWASELNSRLLNN